jgi:predicted CopG family antitoxin
MQKYTTIVVRVETRDKLKKLRRTRRESYDEIINRLLERCGGVEGKDKRD